jgi:tetratricopeptide (TPR) repeat protein
VGSDSAAEAAYRQAATLDSGYITPWDNLLAIQIGRARFDSAAATLADIRRRFAPGAVMDEREVMLLVGRRQYGAAEVRLRELLPRYRSDPRAYGRELRYLGAILALQGKLAEADRILTESAAVYAQRGLKSEALVQMALRTAPVAWYRGDSGMAGRRLEEAARSMSLDQLPERDRPLFDLTEAAVSAGDTALAHEWLAAFERATGEGSGWFGRYLRGFARGMVLSLEKRSLPAALSAYQKPGVAEVCRACLDPYIAAAFDRLGQGDSALAYLQRWANAGDRYWDKGYYSYWPPIAYRRLGELYQARGDTDRALLYYGKFVALWKDADTELQPRVQEVKQRMAVLAGEPKKP